MDMKTLLVVDCQYDFINGSLACHNATNAIEVIINKINSCEESFKVVYSCDFHKLTNHSFSINGGIWPIHCVEYQHGSKLHSDFSSKIRNPKHRPNLNSIFYKGQKDEIEEYSAFYAMNGKNEILQSVLSDEVIVCGIASEYCVMETVKEILKSKRKVSLLNNGLGFVDQNSHNQALNIYKSMGVSFID